MTCCLGDECVQGAHEGRGALTKADATEPCSPKPPVQYHIPCKGLQQSTLTCLLLGWPEQCLCPVATGNIPADN